MRKRQKEGVCLGVIGRKKKVRTNSGKRVGERKGLRVSKWKSRLKDRYRRELIMGGVWR